MLAQHGAAAFATSMSSAVLVSIRATAWLAGVVGWQWALAPLAIGPVLGACAVGKAEG